MNVLLVLLLLLPLGLFVADGKWRQSLLYTTVIGFLQDPLRKITPNQPTLYVGFALVGILLTAITLYIRAGRINLVQLFNGDRRLVSAVELFFGLLGLQVLNSLFNVGSATNVLIGVGFYVSPFIALWLGFQFALKPSAVERYLWIYVIMALLFAFTLLLSYWGYKGPLFTEVRGGVQILVAGLGKYTLGYTGFWRTSEIAAWHLSTCACFVFILGVNRREPWPIAVASAITITLMVLGTLTGRRKSLAMVGGFITIFIVLIMWRGDTKLRSSLLAGLGGGLMLLLLFVSVGGNPTTGGTFGAFLDRGSTVWTDIFSRLNDIGIGSIGTALEVGGPFGAGIGAAAQGVGGLASGVKLNVGSAEGGLGKIVLELGLAGAFFFTLILALLARLFWRTIYILRYAPPSYGLLNLGLIAYIAANLFNFTGASQVYGDPFVLSIIGLSAGFVLASPTVIQAHLAAQRQTAADLPGLPTPALP